MRRSIVRAANASISSIDCASAQLGVVGGGETAVDRARDLLDQARAGDVGGEEDHELARPGIRAGMAAAAGGGRAARGAEREAGREHAEIRGGCRSFVRVPERRLGFFVLGQLIERLGVIGVSRDPGDDLALAASHSAASSRVAATTCMPT